MSSGPSLPNNPTPAYQYANQPGADQGAYQGAQNLPNYAAQNYPQVQGVVGGVTSGAYGAPQIQQAGNTAISSGNSLVPYAQQALQAGFDPQNAQYNQQFGQQQQQSNVNNAAQGVAGSPYAAGVTNQGNQNFNLNWQQQQLARQQQGAQTATGLLGQQNQGAQAGAGLLQGIPNESLGALGALNQAGGQATGVDQQIVQDLLSYLQGGTSASNAATGQYSAEANASLGQQGINNQQLQGIGQTAASLAPFLLSDRRVKKNVERVGVDRLGLPVYEFDYLWDEPRHTGYMADEVEQMYPWAVADMGGIKAVNYGALSRL